MTNAEKKLAFLLATSPYLDTLDGSYEKAAKDLVANGVAVRDAETIDPESLRKQGEWIDYAEGGKQCTACYRVFWHGEYNPIKPNYCPNCGAKMKGGEEY